MQQWYAYIPSQYTNSVKLKFDLNRTQIMFHVHLNAYMNIKKTKTCVFILSYQNIVVFCLT